MDYEFSHEPSCAVGRALLDAGEAVTVEAGSMITYSDDVEVETRSGSGGLVSSVKDSV